MRPAKLHLSEPAPFRVRFSLWTWPSPAKAWTWWYFTLIKYFADDPATQKLQSLGVRSLNVVPIEFME